MLERKFHCLFDSFELACLVVIGRAEELSRLRRVFQATAHEQLRDSRIKLERVGERQNLAKGSCCNLNPSWFHYWTVGRKADRCFA